MVATGMMKMATGDDFRLWQGAETWSRLVFRGYRGLQRRNLWSRVISDGFSIYRTFWRWNHAKRSYEGPTRQHHMTPPLGRAVLPCGLLVRLLVLPRSVGGLFWSKKNRQKVSSNSENFYFCTKNNTTVVLLKTTSVRVSSNQIIPKSYRIIINMAWILHKL
jgi:hypothetical protein